MINTSIEKLARDIGFDIGNTGDVAQSDLLNGFCDALKTIRLGHDRNIQYCFIADKLSDSSKRILTELVEYCKPGEI